MENNNISFYLVTNRIHVYMNVLREIGSPKRICFMIDDSGSSLIVAPYEKRDLKSHEVPSIVYTSDRSLEINSMKLCRIIADIQNWDLNKSYRVQGRVDKKRKVAIFDLTKNEQI